MTIIGIREGFYCCAIKNKIINTTIMQNDLYDIRKKENINNNENYIKKSRGNNKI